MIDFEIIESIIFNLCVIITNSFGKLINFHYGSNQNERQLYIPKRWKGIISFLKWFNHS